jgi:predicted Zn-dependent peptidase
MEFRSETLDNGLTIVAEINPTAASLAAGFFCRTGSRDESQEVLGVSHFLEHMVFKGTPRRSALQVNLEFDQIGANYNAFTSEENTVFYGAVLPEHQDRLVDLLSDILRPSLRQDDFDMEKKVILDEIALYEDHPHFRVYDRLMTEYFHSHPLGNVILGTNETIGELTRGQMQEYFDRQYRAGNLTAVAVGNVDWDALVANVRDACIGWQGGTPPRRTDRWTSEPRTHELADGRLTLSHVGFMSAAPAAQDHARYAAAVAACILGDASGSRLYYALVDPAIADQVNTSFSPMDGTGTFMTYLSCAPDRTSEAIDIVRREVQRFVHEGPTDSELTAARNKIAAGATLRGEVPMGRLSAVGFDWLYRGEHVPLAEEIENVLAVSADEVGEVIREHQLGKMTMLQLGPETA